MVGKRPDRLAAYAALPLPHLDAALAELGRCLDELAMIGVSLQCFCFDESLAAERFDVMYEELNRRKAVVFFHPCVNGLCSPFITQWGLAPTAGTVFEDTTIALHLILRQLPHRFPDISFIVPHLGGALPMLLNRLDNQLPLSRPELPEKPSATARRFYYDTVGHGSAAALRCAVDAFGADRILPGSDYPGAAGLRELPGYLRLPQRRGTRRCGAKADSRVPTRRRSSPRPLSTSRRPRCASDDSPIPKVPRSGR